MKKLLLIFNSFAKNKDGKRLGTKNISVLVALFSLAFVNTNQAQVATNYTWSQVAGSYISITGGTVVASGASIDDSNYTVNLPTGFTFNGANYTSVRFVSNGYIAFGNHTSTGTYSAISSTDTANGIVCAMAMDLISTASTSEMRWQEIGNQIIFQWKQFSRYGVTGESFSFQIVLNTFTGQIKAVYDGSTSIATGTTSQPQVGLRGTANTDYLARRLTTAVPDATPAWNDTAAATTNAHTVRFTSTSVAAYPSAGHTYIWSPVSASVDWANLQWISNSTPYPCQSVDVYTQGYEPGLTNASSTSAGTGISVWIGTMASATDSDPSLWPESAWVAATYNTDSGNNDEFKRTISGLAVGSYRVASRWKISNGTFRYGATNNNFYDGTTSLTGLITVTALPAITATATPTAVCAGASVTLSASSSGSYTYAWDNGAGTGASVTVSPTATTTYTVTGTDTVSGCTNTATVIVTVNPVPTVPTITPASASVCPNSIQVLTAAGSVGTTNFINETFSSGLVWPSGWSGVVSSGIDTVTVTATTNAGGSANEINFKSNNGTTVSGLDRAIYGPFNTTGQTSLNLSWNNYLKHYSSSYSYYVKVQTSTDGVNWHDSSWSTNPVTASMAVGAKSTTLTTDVGSATLYISFTMGGLTFGVYNWYIDNVLLTGTGTLYPTWSPITNLFSDSLGTVPYNGENLETVYFKSPTSGNTVYTTTSTLGSCYKTATTSLTVKTPVAITSATAAATTICSGDTTTLTANGVAGDNAVVTWYSGAGATGTNYGTGLTLPNAAPGTYYAHVTGDCGTAVEASVTITAGATTTWTSSGWDNGAPNASMTAIIAATYSESADITACSLTVTGNVTATIPTGYDVFLSKGLTVDSGSTFNLSSDSNLVQNTGTTNLNGGAGTVNIQRATVPLMRLDYVMWGSPVAGQQLQAFSPETLSNRFYTYSTSVNNYVATSSTANFADATGYLIRMPALHPYTATAWTGTFTGVPHSGDYSATLTNLSATQRFNAIANPYPSTISISSFVAANSSNITGTLYFWRKTNSTTVTPGYCTWAGGTFTGNGQPGATDIGGVLEVGQGFIVEASASGSQAVFNNAMRTGNNTSHLLKNNTIDYNRIWLNITSPANEFSQMAVGYITGATNDVDLFDGKQFSSGPISLNMKINDLPYVIQGKSLPFADTDVVPLSYKVTNAGSYTIAIDHVDGLFSNGTQDIFIKDNLNNTYTNLNNGSFTFASDAGTFDNRLELVFRSSALATSNQIAKDIVVFKQNDQIVIEGGNVEISKVEVYDLRGRLVINKKDVNATSTRLQSITQNQVLIVKVTATDNTIFTKKVMN